MESSQIEKERREKGLHGERDAERETAKGTNIKNERKRLVAKNSLDTAVFSPMLLVDPLKPCKKESILAKLVVTFFQWIGKKLQSVGKRKKRKRSARSLLHNLPLFVH
mmetsp:Transcript_23243/g.45728  ORF Transcript_23243/g.45728 Transcript_23243/m.45728 type:complete len:108 (-) Transcript_23243:380-703(-)